MTFAPATEQLLQLFIIVSGVLLVPVVVGLLLVLFKLAFLLHSTQQLLTVASYEMAPLVKQLRLVVDHLEDIGQRTSSGVQEIGNSIHQAGPLLKRGMGQVRLGASALLTGLSRSFQR